MPYKYYKPEEVLSPRAYVSEVETIFDSDEGNDEGPIGGGYSIARLKWGGDKVVGIRWNVNQNEWDDDAKANGQVKCVGEPNSRGYPTWYIVPEEFLEAMLDANSAVAQKIKALLAEKE